MKTGHAYRRLAITLARIDGAYAHSTIRAYRADFEDFIQFCSERRRQALPANPKAVADYIGELVHRGRRSASIRRALAGIASIHQFNGYTAPTTDLEVKLAIRRMHRQIGRYSRQALGVTKEVLKKMVAATDNSLRGRRDRALLLVAYDTLCRRSELLCMQVEDFRTESLLSSGTKPAATIFLRRSKTDPEAQGRWLPLGTEATRALTSWLRASKLNGGPLFRGVTRSDQLTGGLDPGQISRIYKKIARAAELNDSAIREISGHSMRVGAAQDLLLSGASLPLIMHRGRWSKSDTVMRYVERLGVPM